MDLFESMYTTRAMRRLTTEPVPDAYVARLLDAAIRAPSASNRQSWAFIVVTDPDLRRQLGEIYRASMEELQRRYSAGGDGVPDGDEAFMRIVRSSVHLAERLQDAPVHIVACVRRDASLPGVAVGATVYPAIQNLLLAARALGLGATLTTMHLHREESVIELLGVPDDYVTAALVPIGWPRGRFGVAVRQPFEEVTHHDRWGSPWTVPAPAETRTLVDRLTARD